MNPVSPTSFFITTTYAMLNKLFLELFVPMRAFLLAISFQILIYSIFWFLLLVLLLILMLLLIHSVCWNNKLCLAMWKLYNKMNNM